MRKVTVVETESGIVLRDPKEGIVLVGNLFRGDGETLLVSSSPEGLAFTVQEFLTLLKLPDTAFEDYFYLQT